MMQKNASLTKKIENYYLGLIRPKNVVLQRRRNMEK
jgi:hypothetical protein